MFIDTERCNSTVVAIALLPCDLKFCIFYDCAMPHTYIYCISNFLQPSLSFLGIPWHAFIDEAIHKLIITTSKL